MSKFYLYIAIHFFLHVGVMILECRRANAQIVKIPNHPDLYIILIHIDVNDPFKPPDGARLIEENLLAEEGYRAALADSLFKIIKQNLRIIDPKRDSFVLLHFGLANTKLKSSPHDDFNFLKRAYVRSHIFAKKQQNIESDLRNDLIPKQSSFTILSQEQARLLALEAIGSQVSDVKNQHAYLITVTGGDSALLFQKSNYKFEIVKYYENLADTSETKKSLDAIARQYRFEQLGSWAKSIELYKNAPNSVDTFSVRAYEIISLAHAKMQDNLKKPIKPFKEEMKLERTKMLANEQDLLFTTSVNDTLINMLNLTNDTICSLAVINKAVAIKDTVNLKPTLRFQFVISDALRCDQKEYKVFLDVPIILSDPRLGKRSGNYISEEETVKLSLPCYCTLLFWISVSTISAVSAYFLYYSFYSTHFQIELPGRLFPLPLKRHGKRVDDGALPPPVKGSEAFVLLLPKLWQQRIFYRNTRLELNVPNGNVKVCWRVKGVKEVEYVSTLRFPVSIKGIERIPVVWQTIPDKPSKVTLIVQQGKSQQTEPQIELLYPKAYVINFS